MRSWRAGGGHATHAQAVGLLYIGAPPVLDGMRAWVLFHNRREKERE